MESARPFMFEQAPDRVSGSAADGSRRAALRRVVMVTYADFQMLDAVGPLEIFAAAGDALANRGLGGGYALTVLGPGSETVRASSGLRLGTDGDYDSVRNDSDPVDTLVVAGGIGVGHAIKDGRVLDCVRDLSQRSTRITSVCTGSFVLATLGLLEGRRATTHWNAVELFRSLFPNIRVEGDAIFIRDGKFWTSAGVTAGMDLALALVEEDFGREIALEVSRRMVVFLKRPGGQSQFSAQLAGQLAERDPLRDLQAFVVENPERSHTVESMAATVGMSSRHFSREFRKQVGQSPARFVESVRVESARRRLEDSGQSIEEVAGAVGFGSAETMRRAFLRQIGVGPADYRHRFVRAESRSLTL